MFMFICEQMVDGANIRGSYNRKLENYNYYKLTLWPKPHCTCTSFAINRNRAVSIREDVRRRHPDIVAWCKHLDAHYDRMCDYNSERDGEPTLPGMCPQCSGPLVTIDVPTTCVDCGNPLTPQQQHAGICDECLFARL